VFVEVYREHSVTDAADILLISQPTASRALKSLEERLGRTLFERTKLELVPTPAAEILYPHASVALREIDVAFDKLRDEYRPARVAMGTTPELLMLVAPATGVREGGLSDLEHLEARTADVLIERLRTKAIDLVILPALGDQIPEWASAAPVRRIRFALHQPPPGARSEIVALPPEGTWERSLIRGAMGREISGPSFEAAGGGVSRRLLREGFAVFLPIGCATDLPDVRIVEPIHEVTVYAITREPVVAGSAAARIIDVIRKVDAAGP
jgi:DNA-binding transcriptional LysR family regulator